MRAIVLCTAVLSALILLQASPGTHLRESAASLQQSAQTPHTQIAANPEMDRLGKALAGDWGTVETMERSQFFPNGGSRRGQVHARLLAGGSALLYEVHSDGSAGKLDGFHIIWWDHGTNLYYFFACFNSPDQPCKMRGTAHWQGSTFVNDYQERSQGKETQWRDSFVFTPLSHTLTAAVATSNGTWRTFITTEAHRR